MTGSSMEIDAEERLSSLDIDDEKQCLELLDLPTGLLELIVDKLDISAKKELACTCSLFLEMIRPRWKTVVVDISKNQPLALGVSKFCNIETIVVGSDSKLIDSYLSGGDWYGQLRPVMNHQHAGVPKAVRQTLVALGSMLNSMPDVRRRKLRLVLAMYGVICAKDIVDILYIAFCSRQGHPMDPAAWQSMTRAGSSALPRALFEQLLEANDQRSHPVPGSKSAPVVLRSQPFLWLVGSQSSDRVPCEQFRGETLISEVHTGKFVPDGNLAEHITQGMVQWRPRHNLVFKLENYHKLESLELTIPPTTDYESGELVEFEFDRQILPHLNEKNFPMLRNLAITRTTAASFSVNLSLDKIKLPLLQRLAIGKCVDVMEFAQFSHMKALKFLHIVLPTLIVEGDDGMAESSGHITDIDALASLKDLSNLTIVNWENYEVPDQPCNRYTALTQLTELHLKHFVTPIQGMIPAVPMPNIQSLTLCSRPHSQDLDFYRSKFIRWGLQHIHEYFPNVHALYLGTLGLRGSLTDSATERVIAYDYTEVKKSSDLERAALQVDDYAALPLSNCTALKHFQLDVVLPIPHNTPYYKKCITMGGDPDFVKVVNVTDFRGRVWSRRILFYTIPGEFTQFILIAGFHYDIIHSHRVRQGGFANTLARRSEVGNIWNPVYGDDFEELNDTGVPFSEEEYEEEYDDEDDAVE